MSYRPIISGIAPNVCFTGVSLNNPNFYNERLEKFLSKIESLFSHCSFVIGDNIHHYNILIEKEISFVEAMKAALIKGQEYKDQLELHLKSYNIDYNILLTSELIKHLDYDLHLAEFKDAFEKDKEFRHDVKNFALDYVIKKKERNFISINHKDAFSLSISYILEELSLFSFVVETGLKIQVYPSENSLVLKKISNNLYKYKFQNLSNCVHIDIKLKR